jgi:hypothetical protein
MGVNLKLHHTAAQRHSGKNKVHFSYLFPIFLRAAVPPCGYILNTRRAALPAVRQARPPCEYVLNSGAFGGKNALFLGTNESSGGKNALFLGKNESFGGKNALFLGKNKPFGGKNESL